MPVIIKKVLEKGDKALENHRYGECVVVQFIDASTGRIMFRYAPTIEDLDFWAKVDVDVTEIDRIHKELRDLSAKTEDAKKRLLALHQRIIGSK